MELDSVIEVEFIEKSNVNAARRELREPLEQTLKVGRVGMPLEISAAGPKLVKVKFSGPL